MEQPVILDDLTLLEPDFLSGDVARELTSLKSKGMHSAITYPLNFRGEVMGTLHIVSSEVGLYTEDDLDRVSQITAPITMALANARLFNRIERQNLELSRRTGWMEQLIRAGQGISMEMRPDQALSRFVEPYLEAHPFQHFTAWLEEPGEDGVKLVAVNHYPEIKPGRKLELDQELLHQVRDLHKTLELKLSDEKIKYKPLLRDARTALLVPIFAPDRWLGLIILESHHLEAFEEDERVEVQVLAAHIAGVLRNLYFYHDLDFALRLQQGLIQDANALILILERDGKVALVNRALEKLLGVSPESLKGTPFEDIFTRQLQIETEQEGLIRARGDKFRSLLRRVVKGESMENLRVTISSSDDRESTAIFNTSSVLDRDGRFQGFIAIGQNITRYREMEKTLLQAEKMATVGQMAAGVAHELNNPLTSIINVAGMLHDYKPQDETSRGLIAQLNEETRRIENLVHNLMSYSRPSREEMFPLDLRQVVLDSLSFSHYELSRGQVKVETRIPEGLEPVRGIKDQLQQLFINLLTNASHACAENPGRGH
jgi:PAS domain S-box-containing protein